MRTLPVGQQLVRFDNFKSKDLKITEVPINKEPKPIVNEKGKKTTLLTTAIAVASLFQCMLFQKIEMVLKL